MAIEFTQYDTISDLLLYLSDSLTLSFVTRLSRRNKSGERVFFQYETTNGTDKYGSPVRSIKRTMNYFFVIQNKNVFGNGMILRPKDVEMIKMLIENTIMPWFIGDNQAFSIMKVADGTEQLILGEVEPATYIQDESKYISFEPVLLYTEDKAGRGIRMSLYTGDYADMTIDNFMGFYNILKSDMYLAASVAAMYAKVEPYGINEYNSKGLGAVPARMEIPERSYNNSFLSNVKSKRKDEE